MARESMANFVARVKWATGSKWEDLEWGKPEDLHRPILCRRGALVVVQGDDECLRIDLDAPEDEGWTDAEERKELLEWVLCPQPGTVRVKGGMVSWTAENGNSRVERLERILELVEWLSE